MSLIDHYQAVLIFLLVGVAMVVSPLVMLRLVRPNKPIAAKSIAYECGMDPVGDAQVCFDLRFYTDALIFVVFEVEAVFMFPWAKVYRAFAAEGMSGFALAEGAIFVGILALGLVYVWAKGDIDWVKSLSSPRGVVRREGVVPAVPELEPALPEPEPELEPEPAARPAAPTADERHHAAHASHH
ncbi:MAG: NADH-quinone oxidoreductase subunit A [Planctomycetes bacterium]|nr:NADH-quinone oxidoreductase subunit A [Planctomycetota bacterium]